MKAALTGETSAARDVGNFWFTSLAIGWPLPDLLLPAVRIYRQWFTVD